MNSREYIESGILELFVFGKLSEEEAIEVQKMANEHPAIRSEIAAIEKAVINLSHSVSPNISSETYEKIRRELIIDEPEIIQMKSKSNWTHYLGWVASLIILASAAFMYYQMNNQMKEIINYEKEKTKSDMEKMKTNLSEMTKQNKDYQQILSVIRDKNTTIINLSGQTAMPTASAKVYWNKATQSVYVDGKDLPEPPQGMVYQVWSLKMNPLIPLSIGLMENNTVVSSKIYKMDNTSEAETFGITLEPEGGSLVPTMDQLYTLGEVKGS